MTNMINLTISTTATPNTPIARRLHAPLGCLLGAMIAIPMWGCASTSTRPDSRLNEIDPTIAHARQRQQNALEHYNTASDLHLEGKTNEALGEYRKALELNDKLYAAWNNMGQLLMELGNYPDAVAAYQIASGIEPTDPRPEYNIGLVYQRLGWGQDSHEHFKLAIDRDPNYLPALHGIIRSADMLGLGDPEILAYIRNAQLRETDEQWKTYLSSQFYRVQALIGD